jgi:GNAT superfamily N-acetyltransferase
MKSVITINAKEAAKKLIGQMFEGYQAAICLESDKDTESEFLEILSSADEGGQFYFTYIEEDGRPVSGTVSVRLWVDGRVYHGIVYAFTDQNYRKQGMGRAVIEALLSTYPDEFYFCEVLDQKGLSEEELAAEELFCGVSCQQRDQYWQSMGFRKADFDYVNPGLEDGNVLAYNNLWVRAENEIQGDTLLAAIRAYFLYEYGAGELSYRLDRAYVYIDKQVSGKPLAFVI